MPRRVTRVPGKIIQNELISYKKANVFFATFPKRRMQRFVRIRKRGLNMVKVRVSYKEQQELELVLYLLKKYVRSCRLSSNTEGEYKKAYIIISTGSSCKQ